MKIGKGYSKLVSSLRKSTSRAVKNEVKKWSSFALLQSINGHYVCTRSWLVRLLHPISNVQNRPEVLNP